MKKALKSQKLKQLIFKAKRNKNMKLDESFKENINQL